MLSLRRLLLCALCLPLLAGCYILPTSPHETRGGVSVRTSGAGAPAGPRVQADAANFAVRHGFTRQPRLAGPPVPGEDRYVRGETILEITPQTADGRIVLYLHGPGSTRSDSLISRFVRDYRRQFDAAYGGGIVTETGYAVE